MSAGPCHLIKDADVPGGKFLVPGCANRAIYGDDAECQCETISYNEDADGVERCPHCGQIVGQEGEA